jgi:hypothetical protein
LLLKEEAGIEISAKNIPWFNNVLKKEPVHNIETIILEKNKIAPIIIII